MHSRNIHINPTLIQSYCGPSKKQNIHVNPLFVKNLPITQSTSLQNSLFQANCKPDDIQPLSEINVCQAKAFDSAALKSDNSYDSIRPVASCIDKMYSQYKICKKHTGSYNLTDSTVKNSKSKFNRYKLFIPKTSPRSSCSKNKKVVHLKNIETSLKNRKSLNEQNANKREKIEKLDDLILNSIEKSHQPANLASTSGVNSQRTSNKAFQSAAILPSRHFEISKRKLARKKSIGSNSRYKLIRHQDSANMHGTTRPKPTALNYYHNINVASKLPGRKKVTVHAKKLDIKNGALLKVLQNYKLRKFYLPNGNRCLQVSGKYHIINKISSNYITKYKIRRMPLIYNKSIENNRKRPRFLGNKTFTPLKNDDLISKYRIKRYNPSNSKLPSTTVNAITRPHLYKKVNKWKTVATFPQKECRNAKLSDKFINIGGSMYKCTDMSLHKQESKRIKKFSGSWHGSTKIEMGSNSLYRSTKFKGTRQNSFNLIRKQIVSRPGMLIEVARRQKLGLLLKKRNEFCIFYHRFGKCKKEATGECPFIHDPDKIVVCTRYLKGTCAVTDCQFSHKLDKSKMPVCSHFLNGFCKKKECRYRHVRVNPKAPVCRNFLKGHCPHGEECKKKHIFICEEFQKEGKCSLGRNCPLSHVRGKKEHRHASSSRNRRGQSKTGVLGLEFTNARTKQLPKKPTTAGSRYFEAEDEVTDATRAIENISPSFTAALNQKRQRLLRKVEKLKRLYSVGLDDSVINNSDFKENCDNDGNCEILFKSALPDVLPSFIPLEMPAKSESGADR